jgi:hypothetical protein
MFSLAGGALCAQAPAPAAAGPTAEQVMLRKIYSEALGRGAAHDNLRALVTQAPGRLSGSKALERAVVWAEQTLTDLKLDRVAKQEVKVPHWTRGTAESVKLLPPSGSAGNSSSLTAVALGNSVPGDVTAEVVKVGSLAELEKLGRAVAGKIVFFDRAMNPEHIATGRAYGEAGEGRNRGPAAAAQLGAVGALTRSLTLAKDDVPHTGATAYAPGQPNIPAAALSYLAADRLVAALAEKPRLRVALRVNSRWFNPATSHNVIGEIRGTEFPEQIILVGGHLDSWDTTPGAHDDGAGVVQSIEVLRIFRALGIAPRHTVRCVLFTNEENGTAGAAAYAAAAKEAKEKHLFAVESDNGGFQPRSFSLGSTQGEAHVRATRWLPLFEPYGVMAFTKGTGGADVAPLMLQGATVAGLTADSQRYFDYHHAATDTIETVHPRELHLGAAALAALIWLVDTQGL